MEFSSNYSQPKYIDEYEDTEAINISLKDNRGKSVPKQLQMKDKHLVIAPQRTKTAAINANRATSVHSKINISSTKAKINISRK